MRTGKRTRNILLNELKSRYWEELKRRCLVRMEKAMGEGTATEAEVERVAWDYYRTTVPSLQEFYSRYTPEWEVFYENESLPPAGFRVFLQRMAPTFRRRYSLMELDVDYYVERLTALPDDSDEQRRLQEFFLDQWHRRLTTKEFDYQARHIGALCDAFHLLVPRSGGKTENDQTGSRIGWLLLNHPEMYRQLLPYERAMEQSWQLRELITVLGRRSKGEKRSFEPRDGIGEVQLVRTAMPSDIEGITVGNDLNHLLPVEYCHLSDSALYADFLKRYAERRLQVFDSRSAELPAAPLKQKRPVSGQGPFIVCLDTSGSMKGRREVLAKSAVLAVAKLTERTHRRCYIIAFSEEIDCLLVKDFARDLPQLTAFLSRRLDGGTDVRPALDEAFRLMKAHGWERSDLVLVSDFEMPPATADLLASVHAARLRQTRIYGLVFGSRPEMDYVNLCDRSWTF